MTENKKLTAKQDAFCRHYIANGFNGFQAAVSAGYSEVSARESASELLTKSNIQERLMELQKGAIEKTKIGAEQIYEFTARGAFFDIGDVLEMDDSGAYLKDGMKLSDLPKEVRQLIQTVKSKPTQFGVVNEIIFVDKLRLLEMLARFNGMNKDKLEVTSNLTADERAARIAELKSKMEGNGPV